jgi:preprotein translocase subunit SecG
MLILLTVIHVLVCFFLIVVVLLQSGKAADIAGAFGGMGSQTAFGPRGSATLLSKATTIAAIVFMITSIWLSIQQGLQRGGESVIERTGTGAAAPAPAPPAGEKSAVPSITTETIPATGSESAPAAPAAPEAGTPAPQEKAPAKSQ